MGAVGADHKVEANLDFPRPLLLLLGCTALSYLKPSFAPLKVGASQFVVEKELDVGHGLEDVE